MNAIARLDGLIDLERATKVFVIFASITLLLIPCDGVWIAMLEPALTERNLLASDQVQQPLEPEQSFLTAFEQSVVFGGVLPGHTSPVLQVSMTELVKDYRLKGVVLGDENEAIILDAKSQKTTFVRVGEQLRDLVVNKIEDGLVVLSYLGEEIELAIQ